MIVGTIVDFRYNNTHICFENCYYALKNIFNDVKIIKNVNDLIDIDILVISQEQHQGHRDIWCNDDFINYCNNKNIKVFVFAGETIHSEWYSWLTLPIQNNLIKFKNLYQYVIDVDDSIKMNKEIFSCSISKHYEDLIKKPTDKKDKCLFYGRSYHFVNKNNQRDNIIKDIQKLIDIDVIISDSPEIRKNNWIEYINTLSQYRFIISPLSTCGNIFPLRFYESLLVDSIPLQQIKNNTLSGYVKESKYDDCIFFETAEELVNKLNNFNLKISYNKPWLENQLTGIFLENNIQPDKKIINNNNE